MTDEREAARVGGGAQEALQVSETRYRRLFETAQDGILILDAATGRITDANPFMVALLGYSRDEFLGKELWEIGLFKDKEASQVAFQELLKNGYIRYEALPLETKHGIRCEVEFISNVYRENAHQVIQCNIRDITERKRAEQAHRESEERFHVLVEGVKDHAVFMLDGKGRVTSWNTGVKRVLGYDETDFVGKAFSSVFTPEDIAAGEPERGLQTARAEGQADSERWHVRKNGTYFWGHGHRHTAP